MPAVATCEEFVGLLRKSGLIAEATLDQFLATATTSREACALAHRLIQAGHLTQFQAKQLLAGKWKRFILNEKYRLLEHLGSGGMGSVFLADHIRLKRLVALKIFPADRLSDAAMIARFEREAQAIASLDHPHIVRCYDIDRDGTQHFLVMEFIDGVSLQILVAKFGPLGPERTANYLAQTALGLQAAHEVGWVHRDIKPGNLLVDRQGVVKILDLGLARVFAQPDQSVTEQFAENCVLGTADYCSPEQANNSRDVDIRADIYSLGATGYFLLTGRVPFEGTTAQKLIGHQLHEPKPIRKLQPNAPEKLVAVIDRMMAKDASKRYPNPAAVAEALAEMTAVPIAAPGPHEMPSWPPLIAKLLGSGSAVSSMTTPALLHRAPTSLGLTAQSNSGRAATSPAARNWSVPILVGAAFVLVVGVASLALGLSGGSEKPVLQKEATPPVVLTKNTDEPIPLISVEQAANHLGKFCVIEYDIRSVGGKKKVKLYADTSEAGGTFLSVIAKASVSKFGSDVPSLKEKYYNRRVRVTGTVIEWFDDDEPEKKFVTILIDNPENIVDVGPATTP